MVKLHEAAPVKLSNGVTMLVLEDTRLPLVYTRVQVEGAGSLYTNPMGVAEFTAEMLREGAGGRSGKQIVEEAARAGATFTSGSSGGAEVATVEGSGLSSRFDQWLGLMADVLRPSFQADEFNGMRQRRIVGVRMHQAQAAATAGDRIAQISFGDHPAVQPFPPPEALARLTPEMLSAWHRERYAPANTVVSCVGRIEAAASPNEWRACSADGRLPRRRSTCPRRRGLLWVAGSCW